MFSLILLIILQVFFFLSFHHLDGDAVEGLLLFFRLLGVETVVDRFPWVDHLKVKRVKI